MLAELFAQAIEDPACITAAVGSAIADEDTGHRFLILRAVG
jgi:hypothetical protein